jgi:G2/mitotic-specific cyclin 3/4
MLGAGGLKAAAKRTAFGDVSNTVKNLENIRENGVPTKDTSYDAIQKVQDKPAAFLRPAQRPINGASLKPIVSNNSNVNSIATGTTNKPTPSLLQAFVPTAQAQNVKPRQLTRRATTIYKDTSIGVADGGAQSSVQQHNSFAPIAPVHQALGPRHHKSQPQLKIEEPIPVRKETYQVIESAVQLQNEIVESSKYHDASKRFVEVSEQVHDEVYINSLPQPAQETRETYQEAQAMHETHPYPNIIEAYDASAVQVCLEVDRLDRELPLLPEHEEYWEEEEEEDNYDDQGYTTAHSYKSRGDNTTGGATTVLFPKVTSKVKKELAEAKILVESSRTQEEIEDDAWDTSMVAEYGEEIFSYMRELEVRFPTPVLK